MSWAGNVTIYTPAGEVLQTLHTNDVITMYTSFPPVVAFTKGDRDTNGEREIILTTNLPFIVDCPDNLDPDAVQGHKDEATLLAIGGKVVRVFLYFKYYQCAGMNIYHTAEGLVLTSFPMILKPL